MIQLAVDENKERQLVINHVNDMPIKISIEELMAQLVRRIKDRREEIKVKNSKHQTNSDGIASDWRRFLEKEDLRETGEVQLFLYLLLLTNEQTSYSNLEDFIKIVPSYWSPLFLSIIVREQVSSTHLPQVDHSEKDSNKRQLYVTEA